MSSYVLDFQDIDKTKIGIVGGKGANLGEISRIKGILVPEGFCISTIAFKRIIGETPSLHKLLDQLSLLKVDEQDKIRELSSEIRRIIEGIAIPEEICDAIAIKPSRGLADRPSLSLPSVLSYPLNTLKFAKFFKHTEDDGLERSHKFSMLWTPNSLPKHTKYLTQIAR